MSTSDSVVILCNGKSENNILNEKDKKDLKIFSGNLFYVMNELSKKLVIDGEGATKLIKINIINAKSEAEASMAGGWRRGQSRSDGWRDLCSPIRNSR